LFYLEALLCRERRSAAAGFLRVGIDEVEALAHKGLFEVEDHAVQVDEALGIDKDADTFAVLLKLPHAVAFPGPGVEADGVAQAGAAAASHAQPQTSVGARDAFFVHSGTDAADRLFGHGDAGGLCIQFGRCHRRRQGRRKLLLLGRRGAHGVAGGRADGDSGHDI